MSITGGGLFSVRWLRDTYSNLHTTVVTVKNSIETIVYLRVMKILEMRHTVSSYELQFAGENFSSAHELFFLRIENQKYFGQNVPSEITDLNPNIARKI